MTSDTKPSPESADARQGVDRLGALLRRFPVRADLFHTGPLCSTTRFAATRGKAFLHVMRQGQMTVTHQSDSGAPARVEVNQPSLLFYPRPLDHAFHNAPAEGSDFVCATITFENGEDHPLVRALPPLIVLPLAQSNGLAQTLSLLFAETARLQCGQRLIADRLFEILLLQLLRWLLDRPHSDFHQMGLLVGLGDSRLAPALVAMHEGPGDAWSLARLAAVAGMSRSAFAAAFKAKLGESPGEHLLRWRLAIAQAELLKGRPVKAIATELGWASGPALSRAFTGKLGCSPAQWLRQTLAGR